jgi:hypothetical protein
MAYPSVDAENGGFYDDALADSFALNLPSGITNGDLVIMLFGGSGNVLGLPTVSMVGWTELFQQQVGGVDNNAIDLAAFYKVATGPMGATATATTDLTCKAAHTSFRISYWNAIECGVAATGEDEYPDPPDFTPSWGETRTLWLAVCGTAGWPVGTFPSGYSDSRTDRTAAAYGATHSARRELAATSENPGPFTLSPAVTVYWVANTIAIAGSDQSQAPRDPTIARSKPSLELIRNMEMQCDGRFYIDKSGNAVYESRYARHG